MEGNKMKSFTRLFIVILTFLIFPIIALSQMKTPEDIIINRNGILLKGKFFLSEGTGLHPTVILLHGFPGSESDVLGIGVKLAQSGINALTFNYSGTYQSEGKISWDNMQLDIHAAFKFLQQTENITQYKIDTNKIYVGGWCSGGGMAITYAAYHPEVTVVFSIAPSDQTEFMKLYTSDPEIKKMIDKSFDEITYPKGHLRFEQGTSPREVAEAGIDMINPIYDLKKCAPLLTSKNILLIGGWDDKQTTMEAFILPLYRALQNQGAKNVRFIAFQDDHYFQKTRPELADQVINWLKVLP
jgi:hypothetical protein